MAASVGNNIYAIDRPTAGFAVTSLNVFGKIITISPTDYPFFTMSGNVKVQNVEATWHYRNLEARSVATGLVETADYSYEDQVQPTRVSNTCQIFTKGVELSLSAIAEERHGARDNFADQSMHQMAHLKGDLEATFLKGVRNTGNDTVARAMDGLVTIISTNATNFSGVTLTETSYLELQEATWLQGVQTTVCLSGSKLRKTINKFDRHGNGVWQMPGMGDKVVNNVMLYESPFGMVKNILSRDLVNGTTADIVMYDPKWTHKAWLRPMTMKPVPVLGPYKRAVIEAEGTLKYDNEAAFAKGYNVLTE
jgi:hypothetical protein